MLCCLKFATWGFLGQWRYKRRLDASFASSRYPEQSYFAHWSPISDKMACDLVISGRSVAVRLDLCRRVPLVDKRWGDLSTSHVGKVKDKALGLFPAQAGVGDGFAVHAIADFLRAVFDI